MLVIFITTQIDIVTHAFLDNVLKMYVYALRAYLNLLTKLIVNFITNILNFLKM